MRGGCWGTPPPRCPREGRESGVRARSLALLPPPPPPGPPTHHGHLVQVAELGGPAPAQPHQQHRCSPRQHADEEADDDDQAGVGFGGGLRCGGETGTPLPPRPGNTEPCAQPPSTVAILGVSSSPSQTRHPVPVSPPPAGDQPGALPPSLVGVPRCRGWGTTREDGAAQGGSGRTQGPAPAAPLPHPVSTAPAWGTHGAHR